MVFHIEKYCKRIKKLFTEVIYPSGNGFNDINNGNNKNYKLKGKRFTNLSLIKRR